MALEMINEKPYKQVKLWLMEKYSEGICDKYSHDVVKQGKK